MTRIVTVTLNPALDKSTSVHRVIPEHKLRCDALSCEAGGGGLNVARVVQELGGEALAVWTQGGGIGHRLASLLNEQDVQHEAIPIADNSRENFIVYEESSSLQYRFGTPGPTLSTAEQSRIVERIQSLEPSPDYLVLSGSLPPGPSPDFYSRLLGALPQDSKTRVVLDTSGTALSATQANNVFLVKPNLRELTLFLGKEPASYQEIEDAARKMVEDRVAEVILVSLGAGGALLLSGSECHPIRSPTVPIRSKVGAGDSMVGALVHRLAQGASLLEAAQFGVAAGAAAVMTEGSQLCRREDVERLFELMNK